MVKGLKLARAQLSLMAVLSGLAAAATIGVHFAWTATFGPVSSGSFNQEVTRTRMPFAWPALELRESLANVLISRPVFSPDRTVPLPPVVVAQAEPVALVTQTDDAPSPSYIVGGVIISPALRKTLLRRESREAGRWMSEGQTTQEGWRISSVRPDGIILTRGEREIAFALHARVRPN